MILTRDRPAICGLGTRVHARASCAHIQRVSGLTTSTMTPTPHPTSPHSHPHSIPRVAVVTVRFGDAIFRSLICFRRQRSDSGFWFRGHEDDRASTSRHGRRFEGDTVIVFVILCLCT